MVASSAGGGTEVFATQGVALFKQIKIKTAASNYVLRFQVLERHFFFFMTLEPIVE